MLNRDSLSAIIKIINGQNDVDRLELISELIAYCRQEIYSNNVKYIKMTAARKERKEIEKKMRGK